MRNRNLSYRNPAFKKWSAEVSRIAKRNGIVEAVPIKLRYTWFRNGLDPDDTVYEYRNYKEDMNY